MAFDQQRLIYLTKDNARNVSFSPNLTGEKQNIILSLLMVTITETVNIF